MSPQAALEFQIGRYREMSGEDRLAIERRLLHNPARRIAEVEEFRAPLLLDVEAVRAFFAGVRPEDPLAASYGEMME